MPQRIAHSKLWFWTVLCALVVASSLTAAGVSYYGHSESQKSTDHDICIAIKNLDKAISDSLQRGLKTIPTLTYYKQHPAERVQAIAQIHADLRRFAPPDCP